MFNRFANIFWHYYGGALFGFRQRLWPLEKQYYPAFQALAFVLYLLQMGLLMFVHMPQLIQVGLALILFSPQWIYAFHRIPYPVFEYRAYSMPAGVALIIFALLGKWSIVLLIFWAWRSIIRRHRLIEPLLFWEQAQKENIDHGS